MIHNMRADPQWSLCIPCYLRNCFLPWYRWWWYIAAIIFLQTLTRHMKCWWDGNSPAGRTHTGGINRGTFGSSIFSVVHVEEMFFNKCHVALFPHFRITQTAPSCHPFIHPFNHFRNVTVSPGTPVSVKFERTLKLLMEQAALSSPIVLYAGKLFTTWIQLISNILCHLFPIRFCHSLSYLAADRCFSQSLPKYNAVFPWAAHIVLLFKRILGETHVKRALWDQRANAANKTSPLCFHSGIRSLTNYAARSNRKAQDAFKKRLI